MRSQVLMLASGVLFCLGCGQQTHGEGVVRDPCQPVFLMPAADALPAEIESIDDAVAMWNGVAGLQVARGTGSAGTVVLVRFEKAALASYGFYDDAHGEIYVNRGLTDRHERAVTVAHELGHALALDHVAAKMRTSVMNASNLSVEPTTGDADELTRLWGACAEPAE